MSYSSIGMPGILPEGDEWDAKQIEKLLRVGGHIYLEEDCYPCGGTGSSLQRVSFSDGRFMLYDVHDDTLVYENESFIEFMAHVLFFGRDFL